MKKFIFRGTGFSMLLLFLIILIILLPATPRAQSSLLFAKLHKDSLLINEKSPRLILIGGSNLSFGINSQRFKDTFNINPINTAIHANIGLKFMIESSVSHIRKGDIVIVVPEYSQYLGKTSYGGNELLRTILDVKRSDFYHLGFRQVLNIAPFIPKYFISKLKSVEYSNIDKTLIYGVQSFNKYGDANDHWELNSIYVEPRPEFKTKINYRTFSMLKKFERIVSERGAELYVSYPCYQRTSFNNAIEQINQIEKAITENNFMVLGTPDRYAMNDSLIFDTPYHLNYRGVEFRTELLIEDLKEALNKKIH